MGQNFLSWLFQVWKYDYLHLCSLNEWSFQATGTKIGQVLESLAVLTTALIVAFIYSWNLTLVILAFMPLMIGVGVVQSRLVAGFAKGDKKAMEEAGKVSFWNCYSCLKITTRFSKTEKGMWVDGKVREQCLIKISDTSTVTWNSKVKEREKGAIEKVEMVRKLCFIPSQTLLVKTVIEYAKKWKRQESEWWRFLGGKRGHKWI